MQKSINGFSKLTKDKKIEAISQLYFNDTAYFQNELKKFWHQDEHLQKIIDEFSENTLSNFLVPYGVVPNVVINGESFCVPMVIEESSVVAASSKSANFWRGRGGIQTKIIETKKIGHVHFMFRGDGDQIKNFIDANKQSLLEEVSILSENMVKRGGGILTLNLIDKTHALKNFYQLEVEFETCDAMGANYINSILEALGRQLKLSILADKIDIIMCILSNFTPHCRVRASVECAIEDLNDPSLGMSAEEFAKKFKEALAISKVCVYRATTHNKGIMNGVDAVVMATGNDYRAVEACVHAYAARDGVYRGLSDVEIEENHFRFILELPLAVGTIGGLTQLHPMAKLSQAMLGNPSSHRLMEIIAAIGLCQNFAAVRSLVTSGIQKGHMKMHLINILNHLEANENEREMAKTYFENEVISFKAVRDFLSKARSLH